jgi:RNA polymerase sigma-70 factor (ECF subfamily)
MQNMDDKRLLEEFRKENLEAFEFFFRTNQPRLVSYANRFLDDWETSRDIVQEIFLHLWENKDKLEITVSLRSYLYSSVKNQCINTIKHKVVEQKYSSSIAIQFREMEINYYQATEESFQKMNAAELANKIEQSISTLPEQCRLTFELSRNEGMKSADIAKKMDVSVRTVETQIYRALKVLKESLREYLSIF